MSILHIKNRTRDRYHAISLSSIWELDKVRQARALVVGAGALGNEVCKSLAMIGVKLIVVLDRDNVEIANLSRSVFFRESDHGRPKTDVLSERLRDLNPDVEILPLTGDLHQILGLGLLRRMDMIFSCLDSRLARRSVNRMCEKLGKPWVDGAMENLLGDVTVYFPERGPCYECGFTATDREIVAQAVSCRGVALNNLAMGKVPTTPTMGSIIAALQVQEGLKILHRDFNGALIGKRLVVNCAVNDIYATAFDRRQDCDGHARIGEVAEVPEFSAAKTTGLDILTRFEADTGESGYLELGREIVTELRCEHCGTTELLGEPLRLVGEDKVRCSQCGEVRALETTHVLRGTEAYAGWPLKRLGIPSLDVLEVRGAEHAAWYELTGDLESFPAPLQWQPAAVQTSGALEEGVARS